MSRPTTKTSLSCYVLASTLVWLVTVAFVSCSIDDRSIVIEGLSAPRGLAVSQNGTLLIAEAGAGRILEVISNKTIHEVISKLPHTLDSGPGGSYPAGPSAITATNEALYVVVGEFKGDRFGRLYRVHLNGSYEAITDPTSIDLPANNRFANPYDLVPAPKLNGWIVSDSGRNALIFVSTDGSTRDYALFEAFSIRGHSTKIEVVPTGIDRGPDDAIYVGSLTGFPYPSGEATVWRVEDNNNDGDALDPGEIQPHLEGFTAITDIIFDSKGRLYVAEFASNMQKVMQEGNLRNNVSKYPGRVTQYDGTDATVVVERAISPTGIIVIGDDLYISEEFAGRVRRISLNQS